jgi:hypothetical protein
MDDFLFERTDGKRNLREPEFAKVVGAGLTTVRKFRREGLIQCRRYGSRVYYLYPDDVLAWHETMRKVPIRSFLRAAAG